MKLKRCIYSALALMLVAAAGFSVWRSTNRPMALPEFPHSEGFVPAAVVEVEPDFGWRTGDIIPVRIYIRQIDGVECDTKSLTVGGDTRLREFTVRQELMPDGARVLRIDLQLQAFVWQQKVKGSLKIDYRVAGSRERKPLLLPDLEFSTSRTYDGDKTSKHPKDPPPVFVTGYDWLVTLGLGTVGLCVTSCAFWYLLMRPVKRRAKKEKLVPNTPEWNAAVMQVTAILEKLKAGQAQEPLLRALDKLLRRLYNMDAVTVQDLQAMAEKQSALMPLTLASQYCQNTIYSGKLLERTEIDNLAELVNEALGALPRFRPQPATVGIASGKQGNDPAAFA